LCQNFGEEYKGEAKQHADEALEALRQAAKRGYRDAAKLKRDASFAPLRDGIDFQELLREIETAEPPKPE
jgi:hypothetical protein